MRSEAAAAGIAAAAAILHLLAALYALWRFGAPDAALLLYYLAPVALSVALAAALLRRGWPARAALVVALAFPAAVALASLGGGFLRAALPGMMDAGIGLFLPALATAALEIAALPLALWWAMCPASRAATGALRVAAGALALAHLLGAYALDPGLALAVALGAFAAGLRPQRSSPTTL